MSPLPSASSFLAWLSSGVSLLLSCLLSSTCQAMFRMAFLFRSTFSENLRYACPTMASKTQLRPWLSSTYGFQERRFPILTILQTLYTYLGVAALIGLLTGSLLHFFSKMLRVLFHLHPIPEGNGRTAASIYTLREKKRLEDARQSPTPLRGNWGSRLLDEQSIEYAEYLDKGRGRWKEGQGLLSQTILEEDDDSEELF